jgi:hypothetical protein
MKNRLALVIAGLTTLSLVAISNAAESTNFEMRVNLRSGKDALELGKMYKTLNGLEYQVDLVKFYVSNVNLVKADGSLLPLPGISLTAFKGATTGAAQTSSTGTTSAGQMMPDGQMYNPTTTQDAIMFKARVPAGDYRGVRFDVGVPKDLNNRDASLQQLPLGVEAGMFWAWNPGYIFYRFEGKTVIAGKPQPFLVHMGTDAYRMPVNAFGLQTNKVKIAVTDSSGAAGWDLSKPEKRVIHGGTNIGQAYLNLLGGWTLQ